MRLSTPSTLHPSRRNRSERWLPMNPAAPRMTTRLPAMGGGRLPLPVEFVQRELAGERGAVFLEDEVDALPDVLGDRHLRPIVEQLEPLVLLGRDVHGRGDLL